MHESNGIRAIKTWGEQHGVIFRRSTKRNFFHSLLVNLHTDYHYRFTVGTLRPVLAGAEPLSARAARDSYSSSGTTTGFAPDFLALSVSDNFAVMANASA